MSIYRAKKAINKIPVCLSGIMLAIVLAGCPTEMTEQPSYKPQEAPLLTPPASSVSTQGRAGGLRDLASPTTATPKSIEEGRYLFQIYCTMCHGEKGRGDGPVGQKFIPKPADLTSAHVQQLGDEEIFLRITNGFQTMPSFKKDLTPQERWHIVNYVRSLGVKGG
ncbi:MAG: hypothetical protein A3G93_13155 [Nitrospinae bacterium RIFCSPLOWO2_12_FULL_45_22]|nr:MAG: hypothetical protein A3G93_13155 [Nitrospinae bacterium RIFCSPLOWO2_12_FULL_45_22]